MERIHRGRGTVIYHGYKATHTVTDIFIVAQEILVQHRVEAELMGDARGVQKCDSSDCSHAQAFHAVSLCELPS